MDNKLDRFLGCLVGLAVGDALGTTLEFTSYSEAQANPVKNIVGGGPFNLPAGYWTDDTSMALCLADSIIEKGGFDAFDQMSKYLDWYQTGYNSSNGRCFDIGMATAKALRQFRSTSNPYTTDINAAGNGVIMRIAPVPMLFNGDPEKVILHSILTSKTTHPSPQSINCSAYMGWMIDALLSGKSKEEVLEASKNNETWAYLDSLNEPKDISSLEVISGSYLKKEPGVGGINGDGYVINTFEAVLWAFNKTKNFKDALLKIVNIGQDADTTGAVCGQIAGACYGLSGIPEEWVSKIHKIDEIKERAEKIYKMNQNVSD